MNDKEKFMQETFIVCDECGYNNLKTRFKDFGTCLRCKKVLDKGVYFRYQMRKLSLKKPRARRKGITRALLYF